MEKTVLCIPDSEVSEMCTSVRKSLLGGIFIAHMGTGKFTLQPQSLVNQLVFRSYYVGFSSTTLTEG